LRLIIKSPLLCIQRKDGREIIYIFD